MKRPMILGVALLCLFSTVAIASNIPTPIHPPCTLIDCPTLALDMSFSSDSITVDSVTPGAQVVIFALGLQPDGYESSIFRWVQVITDDDLDGEVSLDAGMVIPCKSIWAAVDLSNGAYALEAPPDCPLRQITIDGSSFLSNSNGVVDGFAYPHPYLDLLYVQPGSGAWVLSAGDGYPTDSDGLSNGITTITLGNARLLAGTGTPQFSPSGIVIAIDLYSLQVGALTLDGSLMKKVRR